MKPVRPLRRLAFGLALVLLAAPSLAAAQDAVLELENGVTWETTAAQAIAAEGASQDDELDTFSAGEYLQYNFYHDTGDGAAGYLYYGFMADRLVMYGKNTDDAYLPAGVTAADVFAVQREAFTARYGEPDTADKRRLTDAINTIMGYDYIGLVDVDALFGWDLGQSTALYLAMVRGSAMITVYVNEALLYGQGE
jgi:hypothetical protein